MQALLRNLLKWVPRQGKYNRTSVQAALAVIVALAALLAFTALRLGLAWHDPVVLVFLGTMAALAGVTAYLAERRARELRRVSDFAQRIAAGDLDAPRLLSMQRGDVAGLAQALNRMAERLKSQKKKRTREKDRLLTIMQVMTDGVVILNKSGRVRLLNPAAEHILHITHGRALDRTFVQAARDHRIAEVWRRCQARGQEQAATIELGASQFLRVVVTPLLKRTSISSGSQATANVSPGVRGYLVILQDLTEVRRLQTIRQDFVSNVSHELRTPLASLRALVETLRDGALDDPPAAQRFLDRMEVEVDALTQMVAELLELSRIESGQVPLELAVCNPAVVLGAGAERLRAQTERANISLTVDIPADLPEILVDARRIEQVVTNLVHNAIKFTPPGGCILVTACHQDEGGWMQDENSSTTPSSPISHPSSFQSVVCKVEDTGTGIPESELPRIFERFYKTDRSRAMGGTGLGLAISKHIVQAHQGEIWAESDGATGSAFFFALPTAAHVAANQLTDPAGHAVVPEAFAQTPDEVPATNGH